MKKILILASILIIAGACAAPPTNQPAVDTNRNTNVAAEPASAPITEADATAKEKEVWDIIQRKDYAAFADMLAEDQVEVLSDGVHDKAGSIAGVKQFEPSEVNLSDWKFLPIDKDAFVVAYTCASKGKLQGKPFPLTSMRCSSAWVRRNNKWLTFFHQECPFKKTPPPPPPTSSSSPAKPASSPAATAEVAVAGPDPIANEQKVWDLFKSKNYDAFAVLLAPDFLEVAPDGYYDKAGTVKRVTMFDASKAVLSDFKAAKPNAISSLVTYLVKGPGTPASGERHTTIWVNRDGKWMGLFHHAATPVEKPAAANMTKPAGSPTPAASPTVK
jgi:hypothetical protein